MAYHPDVTAPVLIFGGSFDPPTLAHQVLPMRAADMVGASQVIYVPAAISPHKLDQPPLDASHRLAMLKLDVEDLDRAVISTIELEREGPSYMIDTVTTLRDDIDSSTPLRLLIGDDQAVPFHRWKDWDPIIGMATPLVLPRLYHSADAFAEALRQDGTWTEDDIRSWLEWRLDLPVMDVEARVIRERLLGGDSVDDLLSPGTREYIQANGLYNSID